MCFYSIEVIAFRVNHFVGGIVFHKHRALVTHYVGLSPVRKSNQVKSVFHTMLYINTLQLTHRLTCFKYFQLSIYNSQSASTRNFQLAKKSTCNSQLATRNSQLIDYPDSFSSEAVRQIFIFNT